MAKIPENPTARGKTLRFTIEFDEKPDSPIDVMAYAFDPRGKMLASAALKEGRVELPLDPAALRGVRLYLAPPPTEDRAPTLAELEQMHAYRPVFDFLPNQNAYTLLPIPKDIWRWWLKCKCRVRGQVVKPVLIDGVWVDKPVCEARVHVCEVDPLWYPIWLLPDYLVLKLRDDLLKELQKPFPLPRVDPSVIPWPPPPPEAEHIFTLKGQEVMFNPQPEPPAPRAPLGGGGSPLASRLERVALNPQPLPPGARFDPGQLVELNPQPEPPLPIEKIALNPQPLPPAPPDPFRLVRLNPQPEPPAIMSLRASQAMQLFTADPTPQPAIVMEKAALKPVFEQLTSEVRSGLMATSVTAVRQTLVSNYKLIYPYLCWWPWWRPYFCRCDELLVLSVDSTGNFDATITYPCFFDHPDLYFWVEVLIDGVWTTVYHPNPVCCHTYWNYACGSEVTLRVTDPRVRWCEENPNLDGLNVVITTIGNAVSMSEIVKTSGATQGYITSGEPFAGTLEMRMDLSRSNLIAIGVDHYRWSYRRKTLGDGVTPVTDIWHPMTHPVYRYYKTLVPNPTPPPTLKPFYPADLMGPDPAFPGQNLFRIQPENPPAPGIEWSMLNEHVDMAYAYFETGSLFESDGVTPTAGEYEVKLELFNSSGALVDWSNPTGGSPATPIYPFVSSNAAPFVPPVGMTTDPAPAANLLTNASGDTIGYTMVLYVDNRPCKAFIYDTWVDSTSNAAGPCGFIRFADHDTSLAHLACWAYQPFVHAMFYFRVDKGSLGDIPAATIDWDYIGNALRWAPVGVGPVNGYARDTSSNFSKAILVQDLLNANGVDCDAAAFAETEYVYHTGFDGYQRAYWLDASATPKAFALSPT